MKFAIESAVAFAALSILSVSMPAVAQEAPPPATPPAQEAIPSTRSPFALHRARNLARMAAERANGGLDQYRAEASMHGPSVDAPAVDNGNGSWTFTFMGGPPGFTTPSVESVVTVFEQDWRVVVEYNGPVRSAETTQLEAPTPGTPTP